MTALAPLVRTGDAIVETAKARYTTKSYDASRRIPEADLQGVRRVEDRPARTAGGVAIPYLEDARISRRPTSQVAESLSPARRALGPGAGEPESHDGAACAVQGITEENAVTTGDRVASDEEHGWDRPRGSPSPARCGDGSPPGDAQQGRREERYRARQAKRGRTSESRIFQVRNSSTETT